MIRLAILLLLQPLLPLLLLLLLLLLLRFCCCLLLAAAVPDCSPAARGDIYSKRSPCCQADRGVYRAKHFSAIRTPWQGNRMCGASACYLSQILRSWAERQSGVARRGNPPLAIYQALQYVWYHQQEIKRRHTRHNVWIQSNLARLLISGCDFCQRWCKTVTLIFYFVYLIDLYPPFGNSNKTVPGMYCCS